jgi:hypothetical protein
MKTILKLLMICAILAVSFSSCVVRERAYGSRYIPGHYEAGYYHERWVPGHYS